MPTVSFNGTKSEEAIAFIKQKLQVPTSHWDSMMGEVHAKAFTVAGATKAALLNDLHGSMIDAIEQGQSIGEFRKQFDQVVKQHGWEYKGTRGWRTRVIYDNNMRTAHMAGRWQQIQRSKKLRPYLVYMTVNDEVVRQDHHQWHATALDVDDVWWNTHYPPNGYGCRCYVIQASEKQLKRMGIKVVEAPPENLTRRINTRSGEDYGDVPDGIDVGWDYNVGKAWIGPDISFGKHLVNLPPSVPFTIPDRQIDALNTSWKAWLKRVDAAPHAKGYAHTVGYLDSELIKKLRAHSIKPENAAIIVYDKQMYHLRGKHKGKEKAIPEDWLRDLPKHLSEYQAVLHHQPTDTVVMVFKEASAGRRGRAVIEVNFNRKGHRINSVRSLGIINIRNLKQKEYLLIDGKI